jgi:hypothetical protein
MGSLCCFFYWLLDSQLLWFILRLSLRVLCCISLCKIILILFLFIIFINPKIWFHLLLLHRRWIFLFIVDLKNTVSIFQMSNRKYIICLNVKVTELTQILKCVGLSLIKVWINEICFCISIPICELIIIMQGWVEWVLLGNVFLMELNWCLLLTQNELKMTLRWNIIWFLLLLFAPLSVSPFQIWTYGHLESFACILLLWLLSIIVNVSSVFIVCYLWVLNEVGWKIIYKFIFS